MAIVTPGDSKPQPNSIHKSRKNPCAECTQRNTNCDQEQPICFPCRIYGTDCRYEPATSGTGPGNRRRGSTSDTATEPQLADLLLTSSSDPFDALPIDMTHRSSEVLYHFRRNRAMLARAIQKDERQFNTNLGLSQTDRTWFQMAICLTASHRGIRGRSEFQDTYLHHRQSLLVWIRERISGIPGPVPASYLSIIVSMIQADSASGESESVENHLTGFLSILDKRRRLMKGWQFYDGLIKRYAMFALGFVFVIRQSHWCGQESGVDHILGSMYTQLANEFLRPYVLTGDPNAARRTDGPILVWLCRALQEVRLANSMGPSPLGKRARLAGLEYMEGLLWLKAISAYALTVGTLDWVEAEKSQGGGPHLSEGLTSLKAWSRKLIQTWIVSGKAMTSGVATQLWGKILWLQSDEGLEIAREIAMQAQGSTMYQGRSDGLASRASSIMAI
ncbi:hypothetical protein GQ53DRAFT_838014 [Thozetella sp. PMI_491]|nr:hypothetical protein GQ53DRAFT_838014 [Thozetella sp. PMI_491]